MLGIAAKQVSVNGPTGSVGDAVSAFASCGLPPNWLWPALCQTLHFALQEKQEPFPASGHHEVGHRPASQAVISYLAL